MNTRKTLALTAVVSTLLTNAPAHAGTIVIDDFFAPQTITDNVTDNFAVSSSPTTVVSGTRTLSDNLLSSTYSPDSSVAVADGLLNAKNGTDNNSEVTVSWVLNGGLFAGASNAELNFGIIGAGTTASHLSFLLGGSPIQNFDISANQDQNLKFGLNTIELQYLNSNNATLALKITGAANWDLTANNLNVSLDSSPANSVPEPTLMGLVGISLTGLGLLRGKNRS
jgi:hypothetical protein